MFGNYCPVGFGIYDEFSKFDLNEDFGVFKRRVSERVRNAKTSGNSVCKITYSKHMRTIVP